MKKYLLLIILTILAFYHKSEAGSIYIDDGLPYTIDNSAYGLDWLWLDFNVANDPGTHVDLLDGGSVFNLNAHNNSTVSMLGGSIGLFLAAFNNASVIIAGGVISGSLQAHDETFVTMIGGSVNAVSASNKGMVTINGGTINNDLVVYEDGNIYLYGTSFQIAGNPLVYGDKLSDYGTFVENGDFDYYTGIITGTLEDGSPLNNTFSIYNTGSNQGTGNIVIIPEPCTILLLGLGCLIIRKR